MLKRSALAALVLLAACDRAPAEPQAPDGPVATLAPEQDVALARAGEMARLSLDTFWAAQARPSASQFALKVAMPNSKGAPEHIWTGEVRREGERITGQVQSPPVDVPGVAVGQRVAIDPEQVSDWAFTEGGRMYGHFSTRVLLDTLPAETQAAVRAQLSPTPLPIG